MLTWSEPGACATDMHCQILTTVATHASNPGVTFITSHLTALHLRSPLLVPVREPLPKSTTFTSYYQPGSMVSVV